MRLDQLLQGKATRIKDNVYLPTEAYITPFIERTRDIAEEFIINVKQPTQLSLNGEDEDSVYNRVWIQAVLPSEYAWRNHRKVISMIYALDTRKPVVKFYAGAINNACLNTCIFNPECLSVAELPVDAPIDYSPINRIIEIQDNIQSTLQALSTREYHRRSIHSDLGTWCDRCITSKKNTGFGIVKLAESTPIEAYKLMFYDDKSPYYTEGDVVDGFTVYNAFTQLITDKSEKDVITVAEKTLLLRDILAI